MGIIIQSVLRENKGFNVPYFHERILGNGKE